ncbi:MAG: Cu(I)-responsive transcriptional regulator [Sphingomicrobium sp.]
MKIGQVATASGVSQRMIRHYEKIGLIPPAGRRESGYRDYDQRDLHTLRFIGRARDLGFGIDEIGRLLALWNDRGRASADVKALATAKAAELQRKSRALDEMRRSLEHLAASCHGDDRPECPILGELGEGPD